jgi:hypothetical protein
VIVEAEKVIGKWLRSQQDTRVVHEPPPGNNRATAWVYLFQLNATDSARGGVDHFITALMQLDCYAGKDGGVPEALALGVEIRAALKALEGEVYEGAVVTHVEIVGHRRLPDTSLEPARQRVILTAAIRMHPTPEGS